MDTQSLLLYIFGVVSTLYVLHFGIYLTGANAYDVWQARRRRNLHHLRAEGKVPQPFVSVLIPAHNEELVVERCLESICASTYRHIEIFLVDDASTDRTYELATAYAQAHTAIPITVMRKEQNVGKAVALNTVLNSGQVRGELVMSLDADSLLDPSAIATAVDYFIDPTIVGVAANVQIIDDYTVLGVLQRFEHMVGYRSKKVYSITNSEFVIGGVASTYRMSVLRKVGYYDNDTQTEDIGLSIKIISNGNRLYRVVYAVDVVAHTEAVDNIRALFRQRYRWKYGSLQNLIKYRHLIGTFDDRFTPSLAFYRLPMAILSEFILLLSPFVWGYVIYMTLLHQNPGLVIGAYLTISFYTLVIVWFDEHATVKHRLHLTLYVPLAYFVYYIMDFIQLSAMLRCLYRSKALVGQKDVGSTWISPRRIGRNVLQED